MACPVSPEVERRRFTPIDKGFEEFGNNICFEDSPPHGVIGQVGRLADTEQVAQQTRVEKIKLGTFDDSFGKIVKVRRQEMNDKSGLKNRNPVSCRGMRNAAIVGKG